MKSWVVLVLGVMAASTVAALSSVVPGPVTAALTGLVIVGSGLASRLLAERRRRRERADQPDSVERETAQTAAADSFQVALVVMVALGAVLVFQRSFAAAGLTYAGVAVVLAAYWLRYAALRRRY